MKRPFDDLISNNFKYNSEELVLAEILRMIGIPNEARSQFVEFGAVDGKYLSNTALLADRGWSGVFIEASDLLFDSLKRNYTPNSNIVCIKSLVSPEKDSLQSLDNLLSQTFVSTDFDVCSIDIDSFDLQVWYNFVRYRPKVIIIEINPLIEIGIHNWHGYGAESGNSFTSTLLVGQNKGYTLVCAPTINLYFVRNDLVANLKIDSLFLEQPQLLFRPVHQYEPTGLRKLLKNLKLLIRLLLFRSYRQAYLSRKSQERSAAEFTRKYRYFRYEVN